MSKLRARQSLFPSLGFGLGLRSEHYPDVLGGSSGKSKVSKHVSWFEVISENFMGAGGRPRHNLEKVRAERPIALHGVSLSLGSADPLDKSYLKQLKALVDRFEPAIVSDHLCWTSIDGYNLHDLLPLPYTEAVLRHVGERVQRVQDYLGRRILLENVSSYLTYAQSEMEEWEFLSELSRRADCGLLLDVNNVYVSSVNHGFDARAFLDAIPVERVGQMHLAGHSTNRTEDGRVYLVDTHDHPVCDEVWALYEHAVRRFGDVSTMVEWDANIPEYSRLEAEINIARVVAQRVAAQNENPSSQLRNDVPRRRKAPARHEPQDGLPLPAR